MSLFRPLVLEFSWRHHRAVIALALGATVTFVVQRLVSVRATVWILEWLGLSRHGITSGRLWQLVTYAFLHAGLGHLLVNLFSLLVFGTEMEQTFGSRRFALLYLACAGIGGLGWLLFRPEPGTVCMGASGAALGVLGAFAAVYPRRPVTLLLFFVLPVTLTARVLALGVGVITVAAMLLQEGQLAHAAHLTGGLAGYLYGYRWTRGGMPGWRRLSHLAWRLRASDGTPRSGPGDELGPPTEDDVNRILEKIAQSGLSCLTPREREILDRASRCGCVRRHDGA